MATKSKGSIAQIKMDERWRVEEDLRVCIECEKIEADPARYAKVKALAKEKMLAVAAIASGADKD